MKPNKTKQKRYIIKLNRLIVTGQAGEWCQIPYEGHPKGCPKYGEDKWCPPNAPKIKDYFNLSKPLYFAHSEFDLEADIARRKKMTPGQTERQYRCVLYWQGSSRKQMRERARAAMWTLGVNEIIECPEGMGVNVYATAKIHGLKLERIRDLKICRHVAYVQPYDLFQLNGFSDGRYSASIFSTTAPQSGQYP